MLYRDLLGVPDSARPQKADAGSPVVTAEQSLKGSRESPDNVGNQRQYHSRICAEGVLKKKPK